MKTQNRKSLLAVFGLTVAFGVATASYAALDALTFDLKDPKGVNAVTFLADSPLEPITGYANGISGTIQFDPEAPEKSKGTFIISAASVKTTNPTMAEHLAGEGWLNTEKYPELKMEVTSISGKVLAGQDKWRLRTVGKLTIKDKTIEIPLEIVATYSKGELGKRIRDAKGDLLNIRALFSFKRQEVGLGPAMPHVGDEVQISVSVAAMRLESATENYKILQ